MAKKSEDKTQEDDKILQKLPEKSEDKSESSQKNDKILQKMAEELRNDEKFTSQSAKKQSFISNYIHCKNATEAAKKAGYSNHSAYSQGSRLLKDVEIANIVADYIKREGELLANDKETILFELDQIVTNCKKAIDEPSYAALTFGRGNPYTTMISALALKAKITGVESPQKMQNLGKDGKPIDPTIPQTIFIIPSNNR